MLRPLDGSQWGLLQASTRGTDPSSNGQRTKAKPTLDLPLPVGGWTKQSCLALKKRMVFWLKDLCFRSKRICQTPMYPGSVSRAETPGPHMGLLLGFPASP